MFRRSDPEVFVYFAPLLLAHDDNSIGDEPRQRALNREEEFCLCRPVVAVKNVAVIRVDKAASARLSNQRRRREPTIKQSRDAADSSCFRGVRVNEVGSLAQHQAEKFPARQRVAQRNLATHLRNHVRGHAGGLREVGHVVFTGRDHPGHEHRVVTVCAQAVSQPDNVPRRPTHVQTRNDSENLHAGSVGILPASCKARTRAVLNGQFSGV